MSEFGSGTESRLAALIGDVVGSRHLENRSKLQRRLLAKTRELNRRLRAPLVGDLALIRGDEVQGLLRHPDCAVDIVWELSEAIFPARIVFGLGFGSISTDLYADVTQIDGPAFHRARSALEEVATDGWLVAHGFGESEDFVLTTLFTLMQAIRARWTEKQLGYVREARRRAQKEVAQHFGVSSSTVSESLKASAFQAVLEGEEAARRLLRHFGSRTESGESSVERPK